MTPLDLLLISLYDFLKGTIWKVREDAWQRNLGEGYDQKSKRLFRFGLSICKEQPAGLNEMIPMIHETTGHRGKIVAKGLSSHKGDDHPTSFGHIGPASIRIRLVFEGDKIKADERPAGHWSDHNQIAKNHWKPKLEKVEMDQLESFLKKRNLA